MSGVNAASGRISASRLSRADKVCRTCGGQRYHALNGGRIIGSAERVAHWIRCGLDLAGPYVAIGAPGRSIISWRLRTVGTD